MDTPELIREHNKVDEKPGCEGFISRREFIKRTEIIVSPDMYEKICMDFFLSEKTVGGFIREFKEKNKLSVRELKLTGKLKYLQHDCLMDGYGWAEDELERYETSIYEIVDCLLYNCCTKRKHLAKISEQLASIVKELSVDESMCDL